MSNRKITKRSLFPGSKIPAPASYDETLNALISEHRELRSIFAEVEDDPEFEMHLPDTVRSCVAAMCVPDYHNEDVIDKFGLAVVLEAGCEIMMRGVVSIINDSSVKMSNNSLWDKIKKAHARDEQIPEEEPLEMRT